MRAELLNALTALTDYLISQASGDDQLRMHLRQLAEAILDVTDRESAAPVTAIESPFAEGQSDQPPNADHRSPQPAPVPAKPTEPLPELTLGQAASATEPLAPSFPAHLTPPDADLPLIEARCRLKAEAARWAATRRRLIAEGADFSTEINPADRDLIARANATPNCFLWMCQPSGPSPASLKRYEEVAVGFEAVADILTVLKQIQDEPDLHRKQFEQSLDLLAEAQSGLRAAIVAMDGPTDSDQVEVFRWLKATASAHQIFILRYMRVDDPADPSQFADLQGRIANLKVALQETRRQTKKRQKLLGNVRHKLSSIASDSDSAFNNWQQVASAVDELISDGLPPSNVELRSLLIPAIDDLPELPDVPSGFQLVLREIDRYLATDSPPEGPATKPLTQEVLEVAGLIGGRSIVLIGGDRRQGSEQALKEAFGLEEMVWIETREHQSIAGFEALIARPEVAVVVLAIRWSSHSFGDVRKFCEVHGKPLVRLPGGYSPNQVAAQIMSQCGERLQQE